MLQATLAAVSILLLVRFVPLASLATFLLGGLSRLGTTTFDPSSPLFGTGLLITAVAFTIAGWGFQASIVSRPLNDDTLLES